MTLIIRIGEESAIAPDLLLHGGVQTEVHFYPYDFTLCLNICIWIDVCIMSYCIDLFVHLFRYINIFIYIDILEEKSIFIYVIRLYVYLLYTRRCTYMF